jgi:hypothetical protein
MNLIAAYALLALLYVGAALAALRLYVMIWIGGRGMDAIAPDYPLQKATYFCVLAVCIAGAAIVHAILARASAK